MNFEVFTTSVELQDIPSYTTNITLEGQALRLSFLWNERLGKRVLSVKSNADVVYLQNTILYPNESFELNSNAILDDLPYSVTLVKTGDVNKVGNIFNWSKDFILCFSRTVDLDVKKLNVIYGVTTPSTPILPKPDPIFGAWILNQGFTIVGDNINYTGYKTNGIDTYDSFALSSLQDALVKSFLAPDLQQYAAFTTAIEQLTGTVDWVLEAEDRVIRYTILDTNPPYFYTSILGEVDVADKVCLSNLNYRVQDGQWLSTSIFVGVEFNQDNSYTYCKYSLDLPDGRQDIAVSDRIFQTTSRPTQDIISSVSFNVLAQKIISNAESSEDEVLKLLSEDFINLVVNSVFDNDPSKQFVKLEDLIPQLETNKVLR